MAERGPIIRRGAQTVKVTNIGTLANSSGLPSTNQNTSSLDLDIGILDGNDTVSSFYGTRQLGFSSANSSGVIISYVKNVSIPNGNDGYSKPSPINPTENATVSGETLPTPSKFYKMVGYYVFGATYESFVSVNNPTESTTVNPKTGHTLINTYVAGIWEQ